MCLNELLELLKKRRRCSSDAHLARLLGITPSALSHYKRGDRRPSLARCDEIARLLELDPDDVMSIVRNSGPPAQRASQDPLRRMAYIPC